MSENIVKVFISKKDSAVDSAKRIKSHLELIGGNRLDIFISEDIPSGVDWRESIKQNLAEANCFFLLFGDPTDGWDWCLYESGLFTPLDKETESGSICFHHPKTEFPSPLAHMQHVSATQERMEKFIVDFFGTSKITRIEPALNEKFAHNKEAVSELATKLCNEIKSGGKKNSVYYNAAITLTTPLEDIKNGIIPDNARVKASYITLEIFDYFQKPPGVDHWTWGVLKNPICKAQGNDWITELSKSIKSACDGKLVQPVNNTITSLTSGKVYRPNINRMDTRGNDGTVTIQILLIQEGPVQHELRSKDD